MHRIYFLLPDDESCQAVVDELETIDIPSHNLHVISNYEDGEHHLPQANVWQKTNLLRSIFFGGLMGSVAGLIAGFMILFSPVSFRGMGWETVAGVTVAGAIMGSLINTTFSGRDFNHQLDIFKQAITNGQLLLMVDVPAAREKQISEMVQEWHPEAHLGTVAHKHL